MQYLACVVMVEGKVRTDLRVPEKVVLIRPVLIKSRINEGGRRRFYSAFHRCHGF